ncbi:translocation/assembly module TamB domain-containing protein [candidate division FCPU426 bacterium]|nr:translocation/assembly module TamB domain-containing protein [candidate division FCPU426 bacterium]
MPARPKPAHMHLHLPPGRIQKARHPLFSLFLPFGVAFIIVGGFWLASSSGVVANRYKPQLEQELSKALQRHVSVGHLEGGIFDRVVLRDILLSTRTQVPESLDITIRRVVVQYSLWDILVRKRSLADSIHSIQLIHPLIQFERTPAGKWRTPHLVFGFPPALTAGPAAPAAVPPIRFSLVGGEIRFTDGLHTASIRRLKGLLNLKDPAAARLYLSGRTDDNRRQNVRMSGILDVPGNSFRLHMKASRMALSPFGRVAHLSEYFEFTGGQADLELSLATRPPTDQDLIPGVGVKGKLILYDLSLKTHWLRESLQNIFGVVFLQDRDITLKSMQAILGKTAWTARGKIQNIQTPAINIRVESDELELSDLIGFFPRLAQLHASGTGKAAILIKGQAPDLAVTANFNMSTGSIGKMEIRRVEVITRYHARELRLLLARGIIAQGWLEGRGHILLPENEQEPAIVAFRGDARNVSVEDITGLLGLEGMKGRLGGLLTISGSMRHPSLYAELTAPQVSVSKTILRNIKGRLAYNDESLQLYFNTDWGPLQNAQVNMEIKKRERGWWLKQFSMTRGQRQLLQASGDWNVGQPEALRGKIQAQELPIQTIPLLPSELRHLNGTVNFTGEVTGTWRDPHLNGRFNTPALILKKGKNLDARGELHVSLQAIRFSNIGIDRSRLAFNGQLGFGKQSHIAGDIVFNGMPVKHIAFLGGWEPPKKTDGTIRGSIKLSGGFKQLKSSGDIHLDRFEYGNIHASSGSLDFSTNGWRVWIKEMELVQPQGKFNAVLETELGKNAGPFQILVWMKTFAIGKRFWTGDLKVKGSYEDVKKQQKYTADLSLDNLEVDGQVLPAAHGEVMLEGNKVKLTHFYWGKDFSCSGAYSLGSVRQGQAQIAFTHSNLRALRTVFASKPEALTEFVTGIVTASLQDQQVGVNWRLETAQGLLQGQAGGKLSRENKMERFQGQLQLQDINTPTLFDLFLLAEPKHAPQGIITGQLAFAGGQGKLDNFAGNLQFTDFIFGRWNFKTLKTAWESNGTNIVITELHGIQPRGSLQSEKGLILRKADGSLDVSLQLLADNFFFFSRRYHGHFTVAGKLEVSPFDLQLAVASSDFQLNLYPFNDFRAHVRYYGENLSIRTPADYPYQIYGDLGLPPGGDVIFRRLTISDQRQVYVDVQGKIEGQGKSDLLVKVKNVPADVLARSLGWPQPWTGMVSGSFRYTDPNHVTRFDINVKIDNGSVLNLPFDTFFGQIVVDNDWLNFVGAEGSCVLRRFGKYTILLSGKLPLPQSDQAAEALKGAEMDLRVKMAEGDLSYITFIPYFAHATGKSTLDLRVKGTMDYPSLNGRASVEKGTLWPRLYTPEITHLDADIRFEDNKMYVNKLEGRIGKGRLLIMPGPAGDWVSVFRRLQPHELNLRLESGEKPIRLDTTEDVEFVTADAKVNLVLAGTMESPVLGGTLELSDGQFTFPAKALTKFTKESKPSNMGYDQFKMISRKNIWYYNDMVRAQIKPDQAVVLNGNRHMFSAEGRVMVSKGSFTYLETDFTLDPNEETALSCQGREKPRLDALAKTVIRNVHLKDEGLSRDVTIYLRVRGALGALKITLESEPALTQAQIMSLLTLGEDYSNWSQEQIDQKVQAAGARVLGRLAGNLIGREIEKSIKKITPLDVIDIRLGGVEKLADNIMSGGNTVSAESGGNSDITGTSLLQDTQIDVGKYLTDDLFLNYRGILKDRGEEKGGLAWQSYLGLEYNLDSSKKFKIYKNFDVDSDQELFWGIEGRVQFEGWNPEKDTKEEKTVLPTKSRPLLPTPTPIIHQNIMN